MNAWKTNKNEDLFVFSEDKSETELTYACRNEYCDNSFCVNKSHGIDYTQIPVEKHSLHLELYSRDLEMSSERLQMISQQIKKALKAAHLAKKSYQMNQPSSFFQNEQLLYAQQSSNQASGSGFSEIRQLPNSNPRKQVFHSILTEDDLNFLTTCSPEIPAFPERYPFLDSLSGRNMIILNKTVLDIDDITNQLHHFVDDILLQTGYASYEIEAHAMLCQMTDRFFDKFLRTMINYYEEGDLLSTVHTSLGVIGFKGIRGLHDYYYRKVLKSHDELYVECIAQQKEYEKKRKECIIKNKEYEQLKSELNLLQTSMDIICLNL